MNTTKSKTTSIIEWCVNLSIFLIILGLLAAAFIQPVMESRTYNKLTGANTTWWDAVWVELRVQDQPQKK